MYFASVIFFFTNVGALAFRTKMFRIESSSWWIFSFDVVSFPNFLITFD